MVWTAGTDAILRDPTGLETKAVGILVGQIV